MQLKNGKSAPSAIGHSVYEPISNKLFSLAALSDPSSRPGTSLSDPRQPSGYLNHFNRTLCSTGHEFGVHIK